MSDTPILDKILEERYDLQKEIAFLKSQFNYSFHDLKIFGLTQNQILALKHYYEINTGKKAEEIK